jgi:hypothetical protein
MTSFAPAVGRETAILPLLNGMRHLEILEARFGGDHVLGGQCLISAALDPNGRILHLNKAHTLSFGERDGSRSARVEAIASLLSGTRFEARLSEAILQEMWEKWVFIAATAGITCLMRAAIGDIVAAGGHRPCHSALRRVHRDCDRAGLPASPSVPRTDAANVYSAGLTVHSLDASRYRARRADRGRPYPRRPASPRQHEQPAWLAPQYCLPSCQGLRGAPRQEPGRNTKGRLAARHGDPNQNRGEMKMMTSGTVAWKGGIRDGKGAISTKSGALDKYPYSFASRFEGSPVPTRRS